MKHLLFILALLSCTTAFGQSQKDYEQVMAKFMHYYNSTHGDSILNMFSDELGKYKQSAWNDPKNEGAHKEYGMMHSWKFGGIDSTGKGNIDTWVRFFLVTFDKTTHAMSFSLDKKNKFLTFRPMTFSDYIDSKLAKYYKGEGKENYQNIKAKEGK